MDLVRLVKRHVPAAWFDHAVGIVGGIVDHRLPNDERRDSAVAMLREQLHVGENMARLLVELGVLAHQTGHERPATKQE